ncbi:MAG: SH3 domain-containing protein, partial [Planctomycetota bacterium]
KMIGREIRIVWSLIIVLAILGLGTIISRINAAGQEKVAETTAQVNTAEPEEVVEVTVQKLNLRTGAGTNYATIQILSKGEKLVVVNDAKGWLEVRLPEDTHCWVTKKYIEITNKDKNEGVVKAGRINIRSKPESGENIIGHITEGQTVKIKLEKGEWYQIAPVGTLTGWINKKYTRYWGTYTHYQELKSEEIKKEMTKQGLTEMFNEAEKLYKDEQEKSILQQNHSDILRLYKEIASQSSDKALVEKCDERIKQIEPKENILKEYRSALEKAKTEKKSIEEKYQARLADLYRQQTAPPLYDARGWLESEGKYIGRPAPYKLTMGGKTLLFLKSPSVKIDDYYGQYVGVRGKIIDNKPGEAKIIIVDKIELLNEGE